MRHPRHALTFLLVAALPACAVPGDVMRVHELHPSDFCRPDQLRLQPGPSEARIGYGMSAFHLVNEGARPCVLFGYPSVELQDEEGEEVDDVKVEESHGTFFEETSDPAAVEIPVGGRATFQLTFASAPRGQLDADDCVRVHRVAVEPPPPPGRKAGKDAEPLTAAVNLRPCDGYLTVGAVREAR